MKIFRSMSLEEAKKLYEKLKTESKNANTSISLLKIAMEDIWFFTDGLTKDY